MTRGKPCRPPPSTHTHTHTHTDTHKDGHTPLGQDGEVSWWMECGQTGGQQQNSPPRRREGYRKREGEGGGGGEVRSSSLIVFRAPLLRPGVSQQINHFTAWLYHPLASESILYTKLQSLFSQKIIGLVKSSNNILLWVAGLYLKRKALCLKDYILGRTHGENMVEFFTCVQKTWRFFRGTWNKLDWKRRKFKKKLRDHKNAYTWLG